MACASLRRFACLSLSFLGLAGCFRSPADPEGTLCSQSEPCPENYVCEEGGCVPSQGSPGPVATTVAGTTGTGGTHTQTLGTTGTGTHTSMSATTESLTGSTAASSSTGGVIGTTTAANTGTAGFTNTGGTTGTHLATSTSSTTGGVGLPVCALCTQNSDCATTYCNFTSGQGGYCDIFDCGGFPEACEPYACSPSGTGCACLSPTAATSTNGVGFSMGTAGFGSTGGPIGSTFGTSGTTGGGFPVCSICENDGQCASGYCNSQSFSPGYCDTSFDCFEGPGSCGSFSCNQTGGCACTIVSTIGTNGMGFTAATTAASSTTGVGFGFAAASTGTTGVAIGTTGGTTTGGFCNGPGIQSNDNCGGAHAVCGSGEMCSEYTTIFGSSYYACGCTSSFGTNQPDSCRVANNVGGGNGLVVCDEVTLTCRAAQDLEQAFQFSNDSTALPCATGYGLLQTQLGNLEPDGGELCAQPCNLNSDCTANFTTCQAGTIDLELPDAGPIVNDDTGYCGFNLCGPDLNPNSGVSYYGPCNSASTNDGICQPFANNNGGYYGVCLRPGSQNSTNTCSGLLGAASNSCVAGDVCIPANQPTDPCSQTFQQSSFCLPTCNAADNTTTCPSFLGTQTTCKAYSGDPSGNSLQAGVCQ